MRTIQTMYGTYGILCAPKSRLLDGAMERFRKAAAYGDRMLYADHSVRFSDGRCKPVQKPDWSPDTLLSTNYIDGPIAVRLDLLPENASSAFRTSEGRYALLLALTERAKGAAHIRESLCVSDAEAPCESPLPLRHAIRRRRLHADVEKGALPGSFALRYAVPVHTRVSCIVYGNGSAHAFRQTLESIAMQCCWPHMELLVADNGSVETEKERYYAALQQNRAAGVVRLPACPGIAHALHQAVLEASGEALLFLPAGARLLSFDAVERMLEYALLPHVGAVGGVYAERKESPVSGIIHDVTSLSDGPMMTSRNCYFISGGFDETFAEAGFIHAYTLLHNDRRLYSVITPYARFAPPGERTERVLSETNKLRLQDMRGFETDA